MHCDPAKKMEVKCTFLEAWSDEKLDSMAQCKFAENSEKKINWVIDLFNQ